MTLQKSQKSWNTLKNFVSRTLIKNCIFYEPGIDIKRTRAGSEEFQKFEYLKKALEIIHFNLKLLKKVSDVNKNFDSSSANFDLLVNNLDEFRSSSPAIVNSYPDMKSLALRLVATSNMTFERAARMQKIRDWADSACGDVLEAQAVISQIEDLKIDVERNIYLVDGTSKGQFVANMGISESVNMLDNNHRLCLWRMIQANRQLAAFYVQKMRVGERLYIIAKNEYYKFFRELKELWDMKAQETVIGKSVGKWLALNKNARDDLMDDEGARFRELKEEKINLSTVKISDDKELASEKNKKDSNANSDRNQKTSKPNRHKASIREERSRTRDFRGDDSQLTQQEESLISLTISDATLKPVPIHKNIESFKNLSDVSQINKDEQSWIKGVGIPNPQRPFDVSVNEKINLGENSKKRGLVHDHSLDSIQEWKKALKLKETEGPSFIQKGQVGKFRRQSGFDQHPNMYQENKKFQVGVTQSKKRNLNFAKDKQDEKGENLVRMEISAPGQIGHRDLTNSQAKNDPNRESMISKIESNQSRNLNLTEIEGEVNISNIGSVMTMVGVRAKEPAGEIEVQDSKYGQRVFGEGFQTQKLGFNPQALKEACSKEEAGDSENESQSSDNPREVIDQTVTHTEMGMDPNRLSVSKLDLSEMKDFNPKCDITEPSFNIDRDRYLGMPNDYQLPDSKRPKQQINTPNSDLRTRFDDSANARIENNINKLGSLAFQARNKFTDNQNQADLNGDDDFSNDEDSYMSKSDGSDSNDSESFDLNQYVSNLHKIRKLRQAEDEKKEKERLVKLKNNDSNKNNSGNINNQKTSVSSSDLSDDEKNSKEEEANDYRVNDKSSETKLTSSQEKNSNLKINVQPNKENNTNSNDKIKKAETNFQNFPIDPNSLQKPSQHFELQPANPNSQNHPAQQLDSQFDMSIPLTVSELNQTVGDSEHLHFQKMMERNNDSIMKLFEQTREMIGVDTRKSILHRMNVNDSKLSGLIGRQSFKRDTIASRRGTVGLRPEIESIKKANELAERQIRDLKQQHNFGGLEASESDKPNHQKDFIEVGQRKPEDPEKISNLEINAISERVVVEKKKIEGQNPGDSANDRNLEEQQKLRDWMMYQKKLDWESRLQSQNGMEQSVGTRLKNSIERLHSESQSLLKSRNDHHELYPKFDNNDYTIGLETRGANPFLCSRPGEDEIIVRNTGKASQEAQMAVNDPERYARLMASMTSKNDIYRDYRDEVMQNLATSQSLGWSRQNPDPAKFQNENQEFSEILEKNESQDNLGEKLESKQKELGEDFEGSIRITFEDKDIDFINNDHGALMKSYSVSKSHLPGQLKNQNPKASNKIANFEKDENHREEKTESVESVESDLDSYQSSSNEDQTPNIPRKSEIYKNHNQSENTVSYQIHSDPKNNIHSGYQDLLKLEYGQDSDIRLSSNSEPSKPQDFQPNKNLDLQNATPEDNLIASTPVQKETAESVKENHSMNVSVWGGLNKRQRQEQELSQEYLQERYEEEMDIGIEQRGESYYDNKIEVKGEMYFESPQEYFKSQIKEKQLDLNRHSKSQFHKINSQNMGDMGHKMQNMRPDFEKIKNISQRNEEQSESHIFKNKEGYPISNMSYLLNTATKNSDLNRPSSNLDKQTSKARNTFINPEELTESEDEISYRQETEVMTGLGTNLMESTNEPFPVKPTHFPVKNINSGSLGCLPDHSRKNDKYASLDELQKAENPVGNNKAGLFDSVVSMFGSISESLGFKDKKGALKIREKEGFQNHEGGNNKQNESDNEIMKIEGICDSETKKNDAEFLNQKREEGDEEWSEIKGNLDDSDAPRKNKFEEEEEENYDKQIRSPERRQFEEMGNYRNMIYKPNSSDEESGEESQGKDMMGRYGDLD